MKIFKIIFEVEGCKNMVLFKYSFTQLNSSDVHRLFINVDMSSRNFVEHSSFQGLPVKAFSERFLERNRYKSLMTERQRVGGEKGKKKTDLISQKQSRRRVAGRVYTAAGRVYPQVKRLLLSFMTPPACIQSFFHNPT